MSQGTFQTIGGAQPLEFFAPSTCGGPTSPTVVIAPALGVRASYYRKLSDGLRGRGWGVACVDAPGMGKSPVRAGWEYDWGYGELVEHYAAACRALRERRPRAPILFLGHSIGGQVGLMLGGQGLAGLEGVVVVASGSPWWKAWPGVQGQGVRVATRVCSLLARGLGHFPGEHVGFGGRDARTLIRQWAQVAATGSYRVSGFDGDTPLTKPGPPVLAICVRGDRYAPEPAMRRTLDRIKARELRFEWWTDPPFGGDHSRWPARPDFVVERVVDFAASQLSISTV